MKLSFIYVPIINIIVRPKQDEGMGKLIAVLKWIHVCPVFFYSIVLTALKRYCFNDDGLLI